MRLKEAIKQFTEWCHEARSRNTALAYQGQLRKFLASAGNLPIAKIKPMHVSRWAKSWHEMQAVQRLFNWLIDEAGIATSSPLEGQKLPCRRIRRRIIADDLMVELLRAASPAGRGFLIALRETYARPQEIRCAQWDQIHNEDPLLPLPEALQQGKCLIIQTEFKDRRRRTEPNKPRVLLVSRRLGRLLARLYTVRQEGERHIFLNSRRRMWTNNAVRCLMRRLRSRLCLDPDRDGENIVAYTFRHTCATRAAAAGVNDSVLSEILGHTDPRMTRRYQHLHVGHLRQALERARRVKPLTPTRAAAN